MSGTTTQPNAHPETLSPPAQSRRRRSRWLWWVIALAVLLFVVAGWLTVKTFMVRSYSTACREAMHAGRIEQLEDLAERWLWWESDKAAPWIYLAEAAQQKGDLERAVEHLSHLPDSDPMSAPALVERSTLLFGPLNRPLEGAACCEYAIRLNPRLTEAYRRLIYFYAYTLQRQKMVQCIRQAMHNDCDLPETYVYLIAQDWLSFANAFDENTKWLRSDPDEELFVIARLVYGIKTVRFKEERAEHDAAYDSDVSEPYHRKLVDECYTRFPKNLELLVYYLQTASGDGDDQRVAEVLESAPPEAAADSRFWRYKGWLHSVRGEQLAAIEAYRKALELNPYDFVAQHQWAAIERRMERTQQAETLEELSREGQNLRRDILQLPEITVVTRQMLTRIAAHATKCGDSETADKLFARLKQGSFGP